MCELNDYTLMWEPGSIPDARAFISPTRPPFLQQEFQAGSLGRSTTLAGMQRVATSRPPTLAVSCASGERVRDNDSFHFRTSRLMQGQRGDQARDYNLSCRRPRRSSLWTRRWWREGPSQAMKITCLDKQVGQFLKESFYRIPRFQRPYSWDRTNIEEFWNDAVVENEAQYFIGSFVVYDDKTAMGIVDGQQRITTITLLLCALRNAFEREGFRNLAKGIHGLIERTDISDQRFYVLQTETSYPYLQEHIQKFGGKPEAGSDAGPEEQLLKQAFEYFQSNVNEVAEAIKLQPNLSQTKKTARVQEELAKIRDKLLNLKLIFTALENDDDAYVIFETLNTRGKDLTLSDLVKSHLARLLKPTNKGVDVAKDKWNEIHQVFEASQVADLSVSTFIHHFWLSRYEYITEKKLYKALRKRIRKDGLLSQKCSCS